MGGLGQPGDSVLPELSGLFRGVHLLTQAERAHIRPDFVDPRQALVLDALLAGVLPARGVLPPIGPDRVLLLVVQDDTEDLFVLTHVSYRNDNEN